MRAIEMGKDQAEPSKKSRNCFIYKCRHRTMVVLLICNQRMGVRIPLAARLNIIVRGFESLPAGIMLGGKAWTVVADDIYLVTNR